MIHFDWTINLGAVVSTGVFLVGIGIYIGRLNEFIKHATEFFAESKEDRKDLRETGDRRHSENLQKFEHLTGLIENRRPRR